MSELASQKPADPALAAHVAASIAEARGIYRTLFPTRRLHYVLSMGHDPVWARPEVTEGPHLPRPQDLGADYLGTITCPGPHPDAPEVTIRLAIPRPPTPGELRQTDAPWRPIRRLDWLFRASPLAYEQMRHGAEMLRKRRADRRADRAALPLGRGSALIGTPRPPASDKRPAILIGMHWLEMGGAEKLGFDTVRWALAAGLRVFVVASIPSIQRLADRLPDHPDVTFIRLDRYLPHALWPRYVERLALAENIRAVHIHHCTPLYDSLPMLRMHLPWVRTIDSTHIIEYANGGYPRISGVWSNYMDMQHVISRELVDYMQGTFHAPAGQVVLGRMLDRDDTAASLPPLRLTAGQKTLHVSFIGRLYYQKRPVVVVECLRALDAWATRNGVTLSATIVGEGPFEATLVALLRRHGLSGKVAMLPGKTDIPALLGRSDILLLPSNNEGLALVCYEAVVHGCIPISTRVGSQDEVLPEGLLVPLAPRATVRQTVAAVDAMWRDADLLARHKDGLQQAWTRLSADPTAEEVLTPVYRRIAEGTQA
ncbi:MAG: glycosyltransferase [Paracoccus hibiscisoli]|uniref:glycosyltransferase n=1 Tax=Paracoccus hibiscisoli TaxID=2023261 RepID=UPI00391C0CF0